MAGTHLQFLEEAVSLDDAIGDLPELEGDWWEQWSEASEYRGPNNAYQKLMRSWLPVQRDACMTT